MGVEKKDCKGRGGQGYEATKERGRKKKRRIVTIKITKIRRDNVSSERASDYHTCRNATTTTTTTTAKTRTTATTPTTTPLFAMNAETHHPVGLRPGDFDFSGDFGQLRDENFLVVEGGAEFGADDGPQSPQQQREPTPEVGTRITNLAQQPGGGKGEGKRG